mgnify:CR=1 FL=1
MLTVFGFFLPGQDISIEHYWRRSVQHNIIDGHFRIIYTYFAFSFG